MLRNDVICFHKLFVFAVVIRINIDGDLTVENEKHFQTMTIMLKTEMFVYHIRTYGNMFYANKSGTRSLANEK